MDGEVRQIADVEVEGRRFEILSTPHWIQPETESVLVYSGVDIRGPGVTEYDFIFVVPEPYVRDIEDSGKIDLFITAIEAIVKSLIHPPS